MSSVDIQLRNAKFSDAELLLSWRNHVSTRQASLTTAEIDLASHLTWLEASLAMPEQRRLWIAELSDEAVGSCRADKKADTWELSWMVAPTARGRGVAQAMLQALFVVFDQSCSAQVKADNVASIKVAERSGFRCVGDIEGVLQFERDKAN
ncbi:MAG: GNAT family N-acetyltransferase [Lentilitoribacter sp.]